MSGDSTTGKCCRFWRTKRGLSPTQLAAMVGVSRPALVQWETGESAPTEKNREALIRALGLDWSAFYAVAELGEGEP